MPDTVTPLIDFELDEGGSLKLVIANELWEALKTAMTPAEAEEAALTGEGAPARATAVPQEGSVSINLSAVFGNFARVYNLSPQPQLQQPPCQNRVRAER